MCLIRYGVKQFSGQHVEHLAVRFRIYEDVSMLAIVGVQLRLLHLLHPKPPRLVLGTLVHDYAAFALLRGQRLKLELLLKFRDLWESMPDVRGRCLDTGIDFRVDGAIYGRLDISTVSGIPVASHEDHTIRGFEILARYCSRTVHKLRG